jgi:hypothetical protein
LEDADLAWVLGEAWASEEASVSVVAVDAAAIWFTQSILSRIAQGLETFGGIFAAPYQSYDPEIEKQFLNNQTEILQKEIDAIKKRWMS